MLKFSPPKQKNLKYFQKDYADYKKASSGHTQKKSKIFFIGG